MNPWHILGIAPTDDQRAVKRAYAALLKQHKPESDPDGYQRLREAFDWIIAELKAARRHPRLTTAQSTDPDSTELQPGRDSFAPPPRPAAAPDKAEPHADGAQHRDPHYQLDRYPNSALPEAAQPHTARSPSRLREHEAKAAPSAADAQAQGRQLAMQILDLVVTQSPAAATERLQQWLIEHEALVNLSARRSFEFEIASRLAHWHDGPFPDLLCEAMREAFAWERLALEDDALSAPIAQALRRLAASRAYLELIVQATPPRWWRAAKPEQLAAKALTSGMDHKLFRRVRGHAQGSAAVRALLDRLDAQCPEIFDFELDAQVIDWWRDSLQRFHLSRFHIFVAALPAIAVGATVATVLHQEGELWVPSLAPISTTAAVAIGLTLSALCLFALLGATKLIHRSEQVLKSHILPPLKWRYMALREHPMVRLGALAIITVSLIAFGPAAHWMPQEAMQWEPLAIVVCALLFMFTDPINGLAAWFMATIGLVAMSATVGILRDLLGIPALEDMVQIMFIIVLWAHVAGLGVARAALGRWPVDGNWATLLFFGSYIAVMVAGGVLVTGVTALWA